MGLSKGCIGWWVAVAGAVFGLAVAVTLHFIMVPPTPHFDNAILYKIANASLELDGLEAMFANVTAELARHYPKHVVTSNEWIFNCAGGFKTQTLLLHASFTEYVIFWGSAVHTVGMSGRHAGDFHDFLMTGNFTQWKEGKVTARTFGPGSHIIHTRWKGSVVELQAGTWMLEHYIGFIPFSLPFGLADSLFSNLDWITLYKSMTTYGSMAISELIFNGKF